MAVTSWRMRLTRGHGLGCLLFGCRYPYWHGRNFLHDDRKGATNG